DVCSSDLAYGTELIEERHRHRFEVNNDYLPVLAEQGLVASGVSPDGKLVEIMELDGHPFFVGVQFHPEFKSRPNAPHPLFREFLRASLDVLPEGSQRTLPFPNGVAKATEPALAGANE